MRRTIKRRIIRIKQGEEPRIRRSEILSKGDKGDPIQYDRDRVTLGNSLSTQYYEWRLPQMAEEKLRPMLISI